MLAEVNREGIGFLVYSLGPTLSANEIFEILLPKYRFFHILWHRFFQIPGFPRT